jgi:adenine-specific DNA-methyltransferase
MEKLQAINRVALSGNTPSYVRYHDDFPFVPISNWWEDTGLGGFVEDRNYVVQTNTKVIERCLLMTTDPGDLVLDPTYGSGTTAFAAERWGRRCITIDTSRVPLALARQRILTARFPWFQLMDERAGPGSGFRYVEKRSKSGAAQGGIVKRMTLGMLANNESADEVVLHDRPEEDGAITRVAGPFVVEATLPTPAGVDDEGGATAPEDTPGDHVQRMIEVLRKSPSLALPGNRKVTLKSIRRPARSLALSAEAQVDVDATGGTLSLNDAIAAAHEANTGALPLSAVPVAILFGPADGAVTAKAVLDAAKEANVKGFRHLFVIGFAITADARAEIEGGEAALGLPATYVTATMDLQMGDLLRTSRASQIFAVCGLPEISITRVAEAAEDGTPRWQVRLVGLDVFDPTTMTTDHKRGDDVPCWMLDQDWNGLVFHADQVFFPRTSAWENLKKALKATHEEGVWAHLAGDTSAPFAAPEGTEIAVKVIDDRGNELAVTRKLGA